MTGRIRSALLLAAFPAAALAGGTDVEKEIAERLSWETPVFVPEEAPCADLKACTSACRSGTIYGGSENWPAAAACEKMGDMWGDGRASKKGKQYPEAAARSWYNACWSGNVSACEKEAAYFEGAGDVGKAFAIRASTCVKGHDEACIAAAATAEKHQLPYDTTPMLAETHVGRCDDRQVAESCAWTEAHPEISSQVRAQLAAMGAAKTKATATQAEGATDAKIDPVALKDTHMPVWTQYPYDWAPGLVRERSDVIVYRCFEVWTPTTGGTVEQLTQRAVAATVDQAQRRYGHTIAPEAVSISLTNPRASFVLSGCMGATNKVLAE